MFNHIISARSVFMNLRFVFNRLDAIICRLESYHLPVKDSVLSMLEAQYKESVKFFKKATPDDKALLVDAVVFVERFIKTVTNRNEELKTLASVQVGM